MNIEIKHEYDFQPVQKLIKAAVEPWFTENIWDNSQRESINSGLDKMTDFTRQVILYAQHSPLENHEVVATMGGSLSQMASGFLPPEFRMQTFQKILKINRADKPALIAEVLEETASRDLDLDVYLQTFHLEVSDIHKWFVESHVVDRQEHLWVDPNNPDYYIDYSYVQLPNKAEVLTFQLLNKDKKIFHVDITKASEDIESDRRALTRGKQDNQAYPLSATENELIVKPNQRKQVSPEIAIPLYEANTVESLLLLTARELLKSLNPLVSNNIIVPTDLSELLTKEYFVDRASLSKIQRKFSKEEFNLLNNEVKKMWLLDVILIAILDPFVAYWYLSAVNGTSYFSDQNLELNNFYDKLTANLDSKDWNEAREKYLNKNRSEDSDIEIFLTLLLAPQPQT